MSRSDLRHAGKFVTGLIPCVFPRIYLVHLSTADDSKISYPSWVNIQSAGWVNIQSALTIPTFFSKKITEKVFKNKIFNEGTLPDPCGTWKSLNWITVRQVGKIVGRIPGLKVVFNRKILVSTLERINSDKEFALRRSRWVSAFIQGLIKLRVHHLAALVPTVLQPVIDCTLTRRGC